MNSPSREASGLTLDLQLGEDSGFSIKLEERKGAELAWTRIPEAGALGRPGSRATFTIVTSSSSMKIAMQLATGSTTCDPLGSDSTPGGV